MPGLYLGCGLGQRWVLIRLWISIRANGLDLNHNYAKRYDKGWDLDVLNEVVTNATIMLSPKGDENYFEG